MSRLTNDIIKLHYYAAAAHICMLALLSTLTHSPTHPPTHPPHIPQLALTVDRGKLDDQQLRLRINQKLIESGEKERFVVAVLHPSHVCALTPHHTQSQGTGAKSTTGKWLEGELEGALQGYVQLQGQGFYSLTTHSSHYQMSSRESSRKTSPWKSW